MIEMCSWDLPVAERFDWWCAQAARDVVPTTITTPVTDFRASIKILGGERTETLVMESPEFRSVRTQRLIRQSDPERWEVGLVDSGAVRVDWDRRLGRCESA